MVQGSVEWILSLFLILTIEILMDERMGTVILWKWDEVWYNTLVYHFYNQETSIAFRISITKREVANPFSSWLVIIFFLPNEKLLIIQTYIQLCRCMHVWAQWHHERRNISNSFRHCRSDSPPWSDTSLRSLALLS